MLGTRRKQNSKIMDPILGGCCSIVVSIPAFHAGDPSSIPGNSALCRAIVMSHPKGYARNELKTE